MILKLKANLKLVDVPEAHTLAELLALTFPEGTFAAASGGGVYRLNVDIHARVTEPQRETFLDLMRTLDPLLVETVFIQGRLGNDTFRGYLGPEKRAKEKSRSRLDEIQQHLRLLLPEHKAALRALLADG